MTKKSSLNKVTFKKEKVQFIYFVKRKCKCKTKRYFKQYQIVCTFYAWHYRKVCTMQAVAL